jgi:hypothetical protein
LTEYYPYYALCPIEKGQGEKGQTALLKQEIVIEPDYLMQGKGHKNDSPDDDDQREQSFCGNRAKTGTHLYESVHRDEFPSLQKEGERKPSIPTKNVD